MIRFGRNTVKLIRGYSIGLPNVFCIIVCCFSGVSVNIEISFTASIDENKASRVEDSSRTIYNRFLQSKHAVLNNSLYTAKQNFGRVHERKRHHFQTQFLSAWYGISSATYSTEVELLKTSQEWAKNYV